MIFFLPIKSCLEVLSLINVCLNVLFLPQTGGGLQNRAEGWKDLVNHTRESRPRTPSRLEDNIVRYNDTIVTLQKKKPYNIIFNNT